MIMRMVIQTLMLIWLASAVVHAAETGLSVRQEGGQLTVEGWLKTPVDRATAWSVLTDYPSFPQFVPGIHSNEVLEARIGVKLIEQRGEVVSGPVISEKMG